MPLSETECQNKPRKKETKEILSKIPKLKDRHLHINYKETHSSEIHWRKLQVDTSFFLFSLC